MIDPLPPAVEPLSPAPAATTRIGLVGVSGFAATHYRDIARQMAEGNARLVAATVINPEQEAEKCAEMRAGGVRVFHDYREMLGWGRSRIDLCCIPTGIHLHAPMTLAALEAGMNVLVEKPAAATLQDVLAMQQGERESGRWVAVGYQHIYAPEVAWMKQQLLAGAIGEIRSLRGGALWPRAHRYYARNGWAGQLAAGTDWVLDSPANNALAHTVNLLCFLAGERFDASADLASVVAELSRARAGIDAPDTVCLRALTGSGVPIVFAASHASAHKRDPEILIEGARGTFHWTFEGAWMERDGKVIARHPSLLERDLRAAMLAAVCARVSDPARFVCTLQIASAQTQCVNGAHESSPVHPIGPRWVDTAPEYRPDHIHLSGIERLVPEAIAQGKLFSELGAPWAVPGETVPLAGYTRFAGPRAAAASDTIDVAASRSERGAPVTTTSPANLGGRLGHAL